jgi:large conductance mechanosensitive channel
MLREFKAFILRGNVIDLAVAVVIGAAFGTVVKSFTDNILMPIISIPGKKTFGDLSFTIHHSVFHYGRFINDVISFVLIAAAIFFLVVKPINAYNERRGGPSDTRTCPECLSKIPRDARRCAFCTTVTAA